MEKGIFLKEVIEVIDKKGKDGTPFPFNISFRTLQRNSKTGGKLITYNNVVKATKSNSHQTDKQLLKAVQSPTKAKKNPNHFKNRTRLLELQNGDIKKIHIRLIDSVNGQKMHY